MDLIKSRIMVLDEDIKEQKKYRHMITKYKLEIEKFQDMHIDEEKITERTFRIMEYNDELLEILNRKIQDLEYEKKEYIKDLEKLKNK